MFTIESFFNGLDRLLGRKPSPPWPPRDDKRPPVGSESLALAKQLFASHTDADCRHLYLGWMVAQWFRLEVEAVAKDIERLWDLLDTNFHDQGNKFEYCDADCFAFNVEWKEKYGDWKAIAHEDQNTNILYVFSRRSMIDALPVELRGPEFEIRIYQYWAKGDDLKNRPYARNQHPTLAELTANSGTLYNDLRDNGFLFKSLAYGQCEATLDLYRLRYLLFHINTALTALDEEN